MSTPVEPAFDIATIKPSRAGGGYPSIDTQHRSLSVSNASVMDLLKWCYLLREEEIRGGPPWMTEAKFDIVAQPDLAGQPSRDQDRLMMRKMLAERFHLLVHETQQVMPVYALSVGDGRLRMVPSNPQDRHLMIHSQKLGNDVTAIQYTSATMPDFVYSLMNSIADRRIVDETELMGQYDFTLNFPSTALEMNGDPGEVSAAFFKAIRSIGLQLKPEKKLMKVIVIDRLESPTPN